MKPSKSLSFESKTTRKSEIIPKCLCQRLWTIADTQRSFWRQEIVDLPWLWNFHIFFAKVFVCLLRQQTQVAISKPFVIFAGGFPWTLFIEHALLNSLGTTTMRQNLIWPDKLSRKMRWSNFSSSWVENPWVGMPTLQFSFLQPSPWSIGVPIWSNLARQGWSTKSASHSLQCKLYTNSNYHKLLRGDF